MIEYTTEAALLKDVKNWLSKQERNGIKVLRICDMYAIGYSDLFINARGRFVVIELKDNKGKPTAHQLQFIDEMRRCGATGGVCRNLQDVQRYIKEALYCQCDVKSDSKYCPVCGKEVHK